MKDLVHRPSVLPGRAGAHANQVMFRRPSDRISIGLISAGLSALLAWTALIVPLHIGVISPTDQAIVWILLAGWLGYWPLKEYRDPTPAVQRRSTTDLA